MFGRNSNKAHKVKRKARGAVRVERKAARQPVAIQINKRWLFVFVLFGSQAYAAWVLQGNWRQTVVPIEQVDIQGELRHLSDEQLRQTIRSSLVGGYFTIDLNAVRNALLQLPWVEDASVRRKWPSGLQIRVQEKTAVAYWNDDALLSAEGEVFRPNQVPRDMALPKMAGPDGLHENVWRFMQQLQQQFAALGLQVDKLVLDKRRAWQIYLANDAQHAGALIRLGRNDTQQRLHRFVEVFAMSNAPSLQQASVVDMRYPNGFAMMMNEAEASNNREGDTKTHESEV